MARIKHIGKDAVGDLPSVGEPVPQEDVLASLLHRGLSKSEADLARVPNFSSYRAVLEVLERNNTLMAVDLDAKNIVAAVPANDGVADGLRRLATTYLDLSLAKSGATVWFELYTSHRPVTADYITSRLGPSQPPVAALDLLSQYVSSAVPPANTDHYAFAIQGPRQTFSPQPEKQSDRGAVNRHPHARRKDIRDAFLTDVARYDHTYAKVRGWQLFDVWDDRTTRKLSFTSAKICGLEVASFNSGLVTAMGFEELPGVASPRFLQFMAG